MKKIVLGVSSSIACYKVCDLVRVLRNEGCSVHVVMTQNATKLIAPLTFATLSGNPVHVSTFSSENRHIEHLALAANAALFAVVPATANVLAKMVSGMADDLLTTTYLSVKCPVVVAPAMNSAMWLNPIVKENIQRLQGHGVTLIDPESGELASGESGEGRLANIKIIAERILEIIKSHPIA